MGDHLISINDQQLKSLVETEQILKKLPKGPVKIVAMPPPTNVTDNDWSQYIVSSHDEDTKSEDKGIITVKVSDLLSPVWLLIINYKFTYTFSLTGQRTFHWG